MVTLTCKNCGIIFKTNRPVDHKRKRKFCSWICGMKAPWNTIGKSGENNVFKRPEIRKKLSEARKGKIIGESEETKRKISNSSI